MKLEFLFNKTKQEMNSIRARLNTFILVAFINGMLIACTDKKEFQNNFPFQVSGKVKNTIGNGLPGIVIYNGTGDSCVSDSGGNFYFSNLLGNQKLTPKKSGYVFLPEFAMVSFQKSKMDFIGQQTDSLYIVSDKVFNWLVAIQLPNGLLESSENSNFVSLYDNALASFAFMAKGERKKAEAIFDFFDSRQTQELLISPGGFSQFRDRNGNPTGNRWMGDNAWLLMALNHYASTYNSTRYSSLRSSLENWIRQLQDTEGAIWGGFSPNGTRIGIVTEGMIDAFNAVPGYGIFHKKLLQYLHSKRWDATDKQLISWPGNTYELALDNYAWGFCAFEDFPIETLDHASQFQNTQTATVTGLQVTGYAPDIDNDVVWLEGTGEMVVAWNKAGKDSTARYYLREMNKAVVDGTIQYGTKGLPYVTNPGTSYGQDVLWAGAETKSCISSSAWFLFGSLKFDPFRNGYEKGIPIEDKFWLK